MAAQSFRGARIEGADFTGARLVGCDLTDAVIRGGSLGGVDLDDPWIADVGFPVTVNGVDVVPLIEEELNRRFPGRSERFAETPEALRRAWAKVQQAWARARNRLAELPAGAEDVRVDGEWSFAETQRHLVMAIDTWLGRAILGQEQPYHPLGMPNAEYATDGYDTSVFAAGTPSYADALAAVADRDAKLTAYLATVTAAQLDEPRPNPWAPQATETVRGCLHTILVEEWEHLRYALRDLDTLAARG